MMEQHWYAVYTRPRSEKKAADTLGTAGIQTYCPVQKVRRRWHDRFKVIEEPIFRSYAFVRISDKEKGTVLSDSNVLNFVQHCRRPAVIRDQEIQNIRRFLGENEGSTFSLCTDADLGADADRERTRIVAEHDQVRILDGVFSDCTGTVTKKFRNKACIRLEWFDTFLVAEFPDSRYVPIG
jgi:transcription antitermination factor NusG